MQKQAFNETTPSPIKEKLLSPEMIWRWLQNDFKNDDWEKQNQAIETIWEFSSSHPHLFAPLDTS